MRKHESCVKYKHILFLVNIFYWYGKMIRLDLNKICSPMKSIFFSLPVMRMFCHPKFDLRRIQLSTNRNDNQNARTLDDIISYFYVY